MGERDSPPVTVVSVKPEDQASYTDAGMETVLTNRGVTWVHGPQSRMPFPGVRPMPARLTAASGDSKGTARSPQWCLRHLPGATGHRQCRGERSDMLPRRRTTVIASGLDDCLPELLHSVPGRPQRQGRPSGAPGTSPSRGEAPYGRATTAGGCTSVRVGGCCPPPALARRRTRS